MSEVYVFPSTVWKVPNALFVERLYDKPKLKSKSEELPDLDEMIYVYCRSGRKSKEAASKLAAIGYSNIIECGGIFDWTGDRVTLVCEGIRSL